MRTIVHVGMNKTGSTAIQNSLAENREVLQNAKILYPKLLGNTHHSELLLCILDDDEYLQNFARDDATKRQQGVGRSERLWTLLLQELQASSSAALILSSEFIFGLRPQSLARLEARLSEFSTNIEHVVYLRDPRDHYLSSAQQILKYGSHLKDPAINIGYIGKLRKFERSELSKVTPRVYSRESLYHNDIIADFLSIAVGQLQTQELNIGLFETNTSMSAEAMFLLQRLNKTIWGDRRIVGHPVNRRILQAVEIEEGPLACNRPTLREAVSELILKVHASDLLKLRDGFGIEFKKVDYSILSDVLGDNRDFTNRMREPVVKEVLDIVDLDLEKADRLLFQVLGRLAKWSLQE